MIRNEIGFDSIAALKHEIQCLILFLKSRARMFSYSTQVHHFLDVECFVLSPVGCSACCSLISVQLETQDL
jgi:hypothetical protein